MTNVGFVEVATNLVLRGRRVELRPLRAEHAAGWWQAAFDGDPSFGLTTVPRSAAHAAEMVAVLLAERAAGACVPFSTVDLEDGAIVGATRYLTLRWFDEGAWPGAVEIGGTWLAPRAQRTAVNTEAKYLLLRHAFEQWGVARADLKTDARNERSRRAIERLGATFEGVLRAWQPSVAEGEGGRLRDTAMFSILASEWPARRRHLEGLLARAGDAPEPPVNRRGSPPEPERSPGPGRPY
jgi:N-acetyltransferase